MIVRKLLSYLLITLFLSSPLSAAFKTTIHRVGAGNCVVIEDTVTKTYMVVDCGSSEFAPSYRVKADVEEAATEIEMQQPSVIRSERKPQKKIGLLELEEEDVKILRKEIKTKIRKSLGDLDNKTGMTIKTIFITHPDRDHYDFLGDLIDTEDKKDKIDFLVLGGDPLKYDAAKFSDKEPLNKWMKKVLDDRTKIYFLALDEKHRFVENVDQYNQVIKELKEGKNIWGEYQAKIDNEKTYPFLSLDGEKTESSTKVTLLGVNSLHATDALEKEKIITRLNYSQEEGGGDDNADSFLVKVKNENDKYAGILLTGDATALTTKRLLNLKQDVTAHILLASHHGASSDGSNNQPWIQAVNPTWVFISSGLLHGHPTQIAYENFKKSEALNQHTTNVHKRITSEKVAEKTSSKKKKEEQEKTEKFQYEYGTTNRPIFSTLANGTLEATFKDNNEIDLKAYLDEWKDKQLTGKISEVQLFPSQQKIVDDLENKATIDINEKNEEIEVEEKPSLSISSFQKSPQSPFKTSLKGEIPKSGSEVIPSLNLSKSLGKSAKISKTKKSSRKKSSSDSEGSEIESSVGTEPGREQGEKKRKADFLSIGSESTGGKK